MDSAVVSTVSVASIASSSAAVDSLCSYSYYFIYPKSNQFAHVVKGDGQLSVIALVVGRGYQPDVMRFLVSLDCYHSSVNGLKPRASSFSTSPGVGGGGVGFGSVRIILSSSLIMLLTLPIF